MRRLYRNLLEIGYDEAAIRRMPMRTAFGHMADVYEEQRAQAEEGTGTGTDDRPMNRQSSAMAAAIAKQNADRREGGHALPKGTSRATLR